LPDISPDISSYDGFFRCHPEEAVELSGKAFAVLESNDNGKLMEPGSMPDR
jgi:hypothetical protein